MILVDTHALVWFVDGQSNLGPMAREMTETALKGDAGYVLAMSFWELAMLRVQGRLNFETSVAAWRKTTLVQGFIKTPVTGDIGIAAAELEEFHADPADRFIVASAVLNGLTLITAERRILDWPGQLRRHDARL